MTEEKGYWTARNALSNSGSRRKRLSRRQMLQRAALGGAGFAAAAVLGCRGGSEPAGRPAAVTDTGQLTIEQRLYEGAKKEGKVVWWSTINIDDAVHYQKAFEEKYRGVKIEYFEASADVIMERVLLEHQAGRSTADVFNSNEYIPLRDAGVLADLSDLVEPPAYPPELFHPAKDGAYYQYTVYTLAYNTNRVRPEEAPRRWEDLLNPRWRGRIALERRLLALVYGTDIPEYQGKVQGLWSEDRMVDFLTQLRAQNPRLEQGNSVVMTKLLAGEYDVAVVLLHQVLAEQQQRAPVDAAPVDRAFVVPGSAYVYKNTPRLNAAKLLMRWWIGPEGNQLADRLRPTGNPLPGAGTTPAKVLEQKGTKPILLTIDHQNHLERLRRRYQQILGVPG